MLLLTLLTLTLAPGHAAPTVTTAAVTQAPPAAKAAPAAPAPVALPWRITKTEWSDADERNYSNWVQALGRSGCNNITSCLRSSANVYRTSDPANASFFTDCADLPYTLRSYFAWKNGLPFSYASEMSSADAQNADIRYSPNGNIVSSRRDLLNVPSATRSFLDMSNMISSAMFRFDPAALSNEDSFDVGGGEMMARLVPDFYPVKINRQSVKPGTVIYDPAGHVAVVYSVENDGRVLFLDAHPDNSITHGTYGAKFARSRPGMGAGFKNFRPLKLVGATLKNGAYTGGKIYLKKNEKIADYDVTQFYGVMRAASWSKGTFTVADQNVNYYDWVRSSLAVGNLQFHPVNEMANMIDALCQDIKDRVTAVQAAVTAGVDRRVEPTRLPRNIYGTDGEWESFSSPSRDARLKTSFKELLDQTRAMVNGYTGKDARIVYEGANLAALKADLIKTYREHAEACQVRYSLSNGSFQALNLEHIRQRLFALSFDPYQCAELRWGAPEASAERAGCRNDANELDWYNAQQRLRNQTERTYDARMDNDLAGLQSKAVGSGVDAAPNVDLPGYLNSIQAQ